jgi:hypothetical protein
MELCYSIFTWGLKAWIERRVWTSIYRWMEVYPCIHVLSISFLGSNQPKLDDHDHLEFASLHGTMHQGSGCNRWVSRQRGVQPTPSLPYELAPSSMVGSWLGVEWHMLKNLPRHIGLSKCGPINPCDFIFHSWESTTWRTGSTPA